MFPFTLKQIRILQTIIDEKSFQSASKNLYLSQPTLSREIQKLENNLNLTLLNREKNEIFLTSAGKQFLAYAIRILFLCEESCRILYSVYNKNKDNFNIGTNLFFGKYLVPKLLVLINKSYPNYNLTLKMGSTTMLLTQMLNNRIDIGICLIKLNKTLIKYLNCSILGTDKIKLILSASNINQRKYKLTKENLFSLKFFTLISQLDFYKLYNLKKKNLKKFKFQSRYQLYSVEAIKTAVIFNLGIGFLSSINLKKELKQNNIIIKNIGISQKIFLLNCKN